MSNDAARQPVRAALEAGGYSPRVTQVVIDLLDALDQAPHTGSGFTARAVADFVELATRPGRDLELRQLLRIARTARTAEDAVASVAEPTWLDDPRFVAAYAEARSVAAWRRHIRWRVHVLVAMAAAASHHVGNFVECGVDTGGTARAVMAYLGDDAFDDRLFYLFDTFHGLVPSQLEPDEVARAGYGEERYPDVLEVARANFADKPYVRIVPGAVPDSLGSYDGAPVAFLHIDMNAARPEVAALSHFWPILAPGACVVFDDYGFPGHGTQRRALDALTRQLGVEIMGLPTGQGVVLKPVEGGADRARAGHRPVEPR